MVSLFSCSAADKYKLNVVEEYINAINAGNINKLEELMAHDHLFIDAHDNRLIGRENMKQSWIGYFSMFPDYKIEIDEVLIKDSIICILGYASGTYKNIKNAENSKESTCRLDSNC